MGLEEALGLGGGVWTLECLTRLNSGGVTTRFLTHFILASGLSNTLYDWTVVTPNESSTLRFVSTPYESRYL